MRITGGSLSSRKIKFVANDAVRPTLSKTRQALFNSLASIIDFENKSFLDMFSGSGIMMFEAFSRGFVEVIGIEKDRRTARNISQNIRDLKVPCELFMGDSLKVSIRLKRGFDVIFVDPPYQSDLYGKSINVIKNNNLLNENGILILEYPAGKNIDISGFEIIKEKAYADKVIAFLSEKVD